MGIVETVGNLVADVIKFALNRSTASAEIKTEAALAARTALAMTENYLGDLENSDEHNRDAQRQLAIEWQTASAKMKPVDGQVAAEFDNFARVWSAGDRERLTSEGLLRYVIHLRTLFADHRVADNEGPTA